MNTAEPFWLVPAADGSEDLELVGIVDLLRRAEMNVVVAGVHGPQTLRCARGTLITPDASLDAIAHNDRCAGIVLPGGMPGTRVLEQSPSLRMRLQHQASGPGWIAAICAAPRVLAAAGLLSGRRYTAYPGAIESWIDEQCGDSRAGDNAASRIPDPTGTAVEVDGKLITGRGPGVVIDFALTIIEHARPQARERVEASLQRA